MRRARGTMAALGRLTVFIVTCAAVLGYIDYRVAKASVMERLLGIGQRMAPFMDDARGIEPPREVHMNGLRMWVAAGKTDRSPTEVRRWYAERYAGRGTANDAITEGLRAAKALPPSVNGLSQATFGDDNIGGMAALDLGSGTTASMLKTIKANLGKLAAGQIGEVGHLRYLYYERTGNGGTRYLTVWTDDRFDLTKFLPTGGDDAPGRDIDDVPRYPGSVRVLSADERGRLGQMAVYNGTGSPETAAMFYEARMRTLGWAPDPRFTQYASNNGMHSLRFANQKGHEIIIDLAADDHHGQGLTVTMLQLH
jgi:hypothetical protein